MAGPRIPLLRPWLALALLLGAAMAAMAQVGTPATDVPSSKCYECHRAGGTAAASAITEIMSLHPPSTLRIESGASVQLDVTLQNEFTARLERIAATLDLTNAPGFAFGEPPEPVLDRTRDVTIPAEPQTLVEERAARVQLEVPEGATAVRIRLAPQSAGAAAPDLTLRLWDPHANTGGSPQNEVDEAGAGGTETFRLRDLSSVALRGTGTWTVEAAMEAVSGKPQAAFLVEQPVRFTLDAWFNQSGDRANTLLSAAMLDGKLEERPATTLSWTLFVTGPPREGDRLVIRAEADAFYKHAPQFNAVDVWRFGKTLTVPIEIPVTENQTDPGTVTLNATTTTTAKPSATPGLQLSADGVGEALGYTAVFLYASSTVAGGMFGLRRAFNRLFGAAKRRIAFHNAVSYLLIVFAVLHAALFLVDAIEPKFHWSVGLMVGGAATLGLAGLAFTGAFQIPMIRGIGYKPWRVLHYGLAVITILATAAHMGLDGIHFEWLQKQIGWQDPVVQALS